MVVTYGAVTREYIACIVRMYICIYNTHTHTFFFFFFFHAISCFFVFVCSLFFFCALSYFQGAEDAQVHRGRDRERPGAVPGSRRRGARSGRPQDPASGPGGRPAEEDGAQPARHLRRGAVLSVRSFVPSFTWFVTAAAVLLRSYIYTMYIDQQVRTAVSIGLRFVQTQTEILTRYLLEKRHMGSYQVCVCVCCVCERERESACVCVRERVCV